MLVMMLIMVLLCQGVLRVLASGPPLPIQPQDTAHPDLRVHVREGEADQRKLNVTEPSNEHLKRHGEAMLSRQMLKALAETTSYTCDIALTTPIAKGTSLPGIANVRGKEGSVHVRAEIVERSLLTLTQNSQGWPRLCKLAQNFD